MNLPFLKGKKEKKDFFLALIFKSWSVSSILFEQMSGKLSILANHKEKTPFNIEKLSDEDMLDACDQAITAVEEHLPEEVFVNKTIFGVSFSWVSESKIKKDYLAKLKKVCQELELSPVGFIVSIEAVVFYLQKKEGAPVSAVFVEIEKNNVTVYLVKAGKVKNMKSVEADNDYPQTVETILKEIHTVGALPSKIILLDSEDVEDRQQDFLSYPWTANLPFLHLPKVMIFEKGWENEALINGVATQMGFEVLEDSIKEVSQITREQQKQVKAKEEDQDEPVDSEEEEENSNIDYDNFGFLMDQDILEVGKKAEAETNKINEENPEEGHEGKENKTFKLNAGKIFGKLRSSLNKIKGLPLKKKLSFQKEKNKLYESDSVQEMPWKPGSKTSFSSDEKAYDKIPSRKSTGILGLSLKIKLLLIPVILVLVSVFSIWLYYSKVLKAEIILFVDKKEINKNMSITLSPDKDTSIKNAVLKINYVMYEEQGESQKATTGKKETGDKATGEVTLYNKSEDTKAFSKGTILISSNNLRFETRDDMQIASTSAFSTSFSSSKVKVAAITFGTEYNLPSDTNFTLKDYPSSVFFGKNETAFSGGTKKEIKIVSKTDLNQLSDEMLSKLKDKALNTDLKSKVKTEDKLLPFIISYKFTQQVFDKKENDEADTVGLSARIEFTGAYYNNTEINNFNREIEKEEIPADYYIDSGKSNIQVSDPQILKDKTLSAKLNIHYIYIPKIDENAIIKQAVRSNSQALELELKKIKGASDNKIIFTNQLLILPQYMPFDPGNIHIVTKINE